MKNKLDIRADQIIGVLSDVGTSPERIRVLVPAIQNVVWIECKLDEAIRAIGESDICIPYNNGGGQTGIRENPLFKGYESLWKSYLSGLDRILSALPDEEITAEKKQEEEKRVTVLELVRGKHTA